MNNEYVVYLMYSKNHDQLYIGYSSDLIDRFHSHNALATKGHTIKYRPWRNFRCELISIKNKKESK
jgi:putative endonuclease